MAKFRIVSWNVNGLRALAKRHPLPELFRSFNADVVCIQETKITSRDQITRDLAFPDDAYDSFWSICTKQKGFSGVATYVRRPPPPQSHIIIGGGNDPNTKSSFLPVVDAWEGIDKKEFDDEGRCIITDHGKFVLFNCYFPNSARGDDRLAYKLEYNRHFQERIERMVLEEKRHVLVMGDVNTAHRIIDIHSPRHNYEAAGFKVAERQWLDQLFGTTDNVLLTNSDGEVLATTSTTHDGEGIPLPPSWRSINNSNNSNDNSDATTTKNKKNPTIFVDTFRELYPQRRGAYTWWDPRLPARKHNHGWRLDYAIADREFFDRYVVDSNIMPEQEGSDHCPIVLEIRLEDDTTTTDAMLQQQQQQHMSDRYKSVAARYFTHYDEKPAKKPKATKAPSPLQRLKKQREEISKGAEPNNMTDAAEMTMTAAAAAAASAAVSEEHTKGATNGPPQPQ